MTRDTVGVLSIPCAGNTARKLVGNILNVLMMDQVGFPRYIVHVLTVYLQCPGSGNWYLSPVSPLSLVPKAGKLGKYRLIQNLSHPHNTHPTPSINVHLNSDQFPCTRGTFKTVCTLVRNLPPGAQAATRDIAEAYHIIPLHEKQWPGVVVQISNDPEQFALNTSNSFGCATTGGLFGLFRDALADLLRAKGISPILKWVDDFIFIRIPKESISRYNNQQNSDQETLEHNGGEIQTGGHLWYKGETLAETGAEQFAENLEFPLQHIRDHKDQGRTYSCGFLEIDKSTMPLGIPWECSKDVPFKLIVIFEGFAWDLDKKRVSLPESKKGKYTQAIAAWKLRDTHTFEDTQKLYRKLLYTCHIIPQGRAYLIFLEKMMASFHECPFVPCHPPKHLEEDLHWWKNTFSRPSLSHKIPDNRQIIDMHGFSDASSTTGLGIVIGNQWCTWRLLPGWQDQGRDIGWAEVITMELLVKSILQHQPLPGLKVHRDNNSVVEGWWTGRN